MMVTVNSGNHERICCPISIELPRNTLPVEPVLVSKETSEMVVAQIEETEKLSKLHAVIPHMPANSTMSFIVMDSASCAPCEGPARVAIGAAGEGKLDVVVGGNLFTSYVYGVDVVRPYLGPVLSQWGNPITRLDLQSNEHPHHRSVWFSHGDVNGIDNWNEAPGTHGRQLHRDLIAVESGCVFGRIESSNTWTDNARTPLIDDTREYRFYSTPAGFRIVDLRLSLRASYSQVCLGCTKEAGPLGIRVAETMRQDSGGHLMNAYGSLTEAECWGRRAPWCDYWGPVGSNVAGIAAFDHPSNLDYPTYWHIRDYGLMAMNNFYWGNPVTLEPGESLDLRYRLIFHSGDPTTARIAERFHDYINPPIVRII